MNARSFSPLLRLVGAASVVATLGLVLVGSTGCTGKAGDKDGKGTPGKSAENKKPPKQDTTLKTAGPVKDGEILKVGFLYVGPKTDYGYNQAHAEGAAEVKKIPGVEIIEQENVLEGQDVQKAMKSQIAGGAKLLFPTSYGYFNPHVLEVAKKNPEISFLHCGGLFDANEQPLNVGTYFGLIDECEYISGIVAGHMTKSKKLGFVAAKTISQIRRNINAFALGARSVDPEITVSVIFTNEWSDSKKEAEATNSLIDKGCDVITCHVDSPKTVVEKAVERGKYVCGYHASQQPIAKDLYLTGAEWNWGKVYSDYVKAYKEGKPIPSYLRGGIKAGLVRMGPYGPKVTPEAKKAADAALKGFQETDFVIFKGPLETNEGKTILPAGAEFKQSDPKLEEIDYLVKGVHGK
jgi:simple sugar transport system substrate-binding protein